MEQSRTTLWRSFIGLLVVIVVAAGIWALFFRNSNTKDSKQKDASTSRTVSQAVPDTAADRKEVKSQTSPTQPAQNKTTAVSGQQQLANAGPGNAASLFAGASIVGAIGHHLYRKRLRRLAPHPG